MNEITLGLAELWSQQNPAVTHSSQSMVESTRYYCTRVLLKKQKQANLPAQQKTQNLEPPRPATGMRPETTDHHLQEPT